MIVISTWKFCHEANQKAWTVLQAGRSTLDAVIEGVAVAERDPGVRNVGFGGHPSAEDVVQAVTDGRDLGYGAVAGLERIATPAAVARRVTEETEHFLLVEDGVLHFARNQGFTEQDVLTSETQAKWEARWRQRHPARKQSRHDRIHSPRQQR